MKLPQTSQGKWQTPPAATSGLPLVVTDEIDFSLRTQPLVTTEQPWLLSQR